jgi:hypothetical protein
VQRAGGTLNGSTWLDRTNYYETVPSNQLALALWLEADRMARLLPAMTQEKLDTQRDVVKNERRWSMDNQPYGTWWERLPALCYPEGTRSTTRSSGRWTTSTPRRSTTCGSSSPRTTRPTTPCSPWPATSTRPRRGGSSPSCSGPSRAARRAAAAADGAPRHRSAARCASRRGRRPAVARLPRLPLPPFGTEAHYAAEVCAAVLGVRQGSRLAKALIREQQVRARRTPSPTTCPKGADLLVVDAVARPGVSADELEAAMVAEVDRLREGGVTTPRSSARSRSSRARSPSGCRAPPTAPTSSPSSRPTSAIPPS